MRAGPGVSHPVLTALNENDQLTIEGKEGEWYFVATVDGQKGYIHQSLVRIIREEPAPAGRDEVAAKRPASEGDKPSLLTTPPVAPQVSPKAPLTPDVGTIPENVQPAGATAKTTASQPPSLPGTQDSRATQAKSPALIHLLEGREGDMILWLAIAVAFFFIGWICGGNYYLRRDRLRRTKLRF